MPYKLNILVEGDDDERFFLQIIKPLLQSKYQTIRLVKYANDPPKTRRKLIKSLRDLDAHYFYVTDIDNKPCVTAKKDQVTRELGSSAVDRDKLIVVVKEIESWYLAGLDENVIRKFKLRTCVSTNDVTKEQFNRVIPITITRIGFMLTILENYNLNIAENKNRSLKYLIDKCQSC